VNIHPRYTNLELFLFIAIMLTLRPVFWGARKSRLGSRWNAWRRRRRAV